MQITARPLQVEQRAPPRPARACACTRGCAGRPGAARRSSGIRRRKRNCDALPRRAWRRTCPCPGGAPRRFSAASSSIALRTVPWLTWKRAASSISLGIASPGFHSPDCRLCVISALICWYSGLKVGGAGGRRQRPAALVADRAWSDADCATKRPCSLASIMSYIRHKIELTAGYGPTLAGTLRAGCPRRAPARASAVDRRGAAGVAVLRHLLSEIPHEQEARPRRRHRRRRPDRLRPAVPHRLRRHARQGPAGHPAAARDRRREGAEGAQGRDDGARRLRVPAAGRHGRRTATR